MTRLEKRLKLRSLRAKKIQLSWHHPLDDSPFGSGTVREARQRLNVEIKKINAIKDYTD